MKVRELPGWPPAWTGTTGGPSPRGLVGVLRSLDWRVDLRGVADLRLTIEYQDHLWTGLYPSDQPQREQVDALGGLTLDALHQVLTRYVGDTMARIGELDVT